MNGQNDLSFVFRNIVLSTLRRRVYLFFPSSPLQWLGMLSYTSSFKDAAGVKSIQLFVQTGVVALLLDPANPGVYSMHFILAYYEILP